MADTTNILERIAQPRWTMPRIIGVNLLALLPVLAVVLVQRGPAWLPVLLVCLGAVLLWQAFFALVRRQPMVLDGLATAIALAIVLLPDIPLYQIALSASFGVVAGELIFGGRAFSFLHPSVLAVAFLLFSFPGTGLAVTDPAFAIAVLPGAAVLLALRLISWRVAAGAVIGCVLAALSLGADSSFWTALASGSALYVLVFFACDPYAAAATRTGRWLYGAIFGVLLVLLKGTAGATGFEAGIFAALLSMVFAPLIDQLVIAVQTAIRERRNG